MIPISKIKRLGKEAFWVGAGQVLAVAGSLVGIRVLTHLLPPAIFGEVALAMTAATLMQQILLGPCGNALMRYFAPAREDGRIDSFFQAGFRLFGEAALGVLLITALTMFLLWATGTTKWIGAVGAASLFSLLSGYNSALDGIQNAARQRVIVAWHQGLGQWTRFAAVLPIVYLFGRSSAAALFGYCLGAAIVAASQTLMLHRSIPIHRSDVTFTLAADSQKILKQMRAYAWPFAVWGIFGWVQFSSDRWALQIGSTPSDVGFYAVLYQLGFGPTMLLSNVLVQLVAPILFQRVGAGSDRKSVRQTLQLNLRLFYLSLVVTVFGTIAMFVFHSQIFLLLAAPIYSKASPLLPWVGLSAGLFASAQIATLSLLTERNSRALLRPKIVVALLAACLYLTMVWHYRITGVVFAGLVASLVYVVWMFCLIVAKDSKDAA